MWREKQTSTQPTKILRMNQSRLSSEGLWDCDGGGAVLGGSKGVQGGWSHRVCEVDLGGAAEGRGRTTWGVEQHHNQECGSGLGPLDLERGLGIVTCSL